MKKVLILTLLLAGCADSHQTIHEELPRYVGQPVAMLQAKLGMPTSETTVMGRKAYVWFTRYASTCTIRAFVLDGIVRDIDGEGGETGCRVFAQELKS